MSYGRIPYNLLPDNLLPAARRGAILTPFACANLTSSLRARPGESAAHGDSCWSRPLPNLDFFALGYPGLFLVALVAATLLPAQSELLLIAMLVSDRFEPGLLLFAASLGNVLGSTINWGLGRFLANHRGARWFPVSEAAMVKAEERYRRYGELSLLLSWVPIIGDPLTLIAGVLRTPLYRFLVLVTIAKVGRYVVLIAAHGYLTA